MPLALFKRLRGLTYGTFWWTSLGHVYRRFQSWTSGTKCLASTLNISNNMTLCVTPSRSIRRKSTEPWHGLKSMLVKSNTTAKASHKKKLKLQIRAYYAYRQIIEERELDFIGTKAHGDLTEYFATVDIAEAFLNDPYDWDGPHEPIVAATEADMDAALTMQIFKHLTNKPVLFSDVRHYDKDDDVWYFSNSGTHATYFAGASMDPVENLKHVTFYSECSYYPAGGASVHHFAAPGQVTLARLARKNGKYWLAIVPGEFIEFPRAIALAKGSTTTPEWPIAFTRIQTSADEFLANFPCNHIHGCYGDWVTELKMVAKILGIEAKVF